MTSAPRPGEGLPRWNLTTIEEVRLDEVLVLRLNNPKQYNAITDDMFDDLERLPSLIDADDSVRAVIITGNGRGFCSGLNLDDGRRLIEQPLDARVRSVERMAGSIVGFRKMATPLIAAVNGPAAGGGLCLALTADIRVACPPATFSGAFVHLGLSGGDAGASWLLPRIVGLGLASEMLLTGRVVGSDEALSAGLVNALVDREDLIDTAMTYASMIVRSSPAAVRMTKYVLRRNVDATSVEAASDLENHIQALLLGGADVSDAFDAFVAKRRRAHDA